MKLSDVVKDLAPSLGTALMGPLGGVALSFLADKLGVPEKTVEAVTSAISDGKMTPEQLVQVKQANLDFEKFCKQNAIDLAKIAADDRASARTASVAGGTHKMLFALSLLLLALTLGSEIAVLFKGYPSNVPDIIVGRVLGLMDAVAMMVMSFWYGTTSGSHQKTELLAQSAPVK